MIRLFKLVLLMLVVATSVFAESKKGSLSVILFSNGKPLVFNEVKIDGRKTYMTDKDGALQVSLNAGEHQIEIFGKNAMGVNLGYFKKQIIVKADRDTQVIATLTLQGADTIDIDTPVAMETAKDVKIEKAIGTGRLTGRVLSSEGGRPISGARVFVRGTSVDTRTDEKGRFAATVPAGKALSISVVHSAYSAQTVSGIKVKANGTTSRTVKLTPASMELEEFVVLAPKVQGSISDVMQEEKSAKAITNILGSKQISKKGDSDAAGALKRITGVTLIGGTDIYVRGLGGRYSNVELNSMPLPSPNPQRRTVPLDIFPASVIGSMKVQKSATADIPTSFGGGYVDIRTKGASKENYVNVSLELNGNSNTGKDVTSYQGSNTDWIGSDDGYRAIPADILNDTALIIGKPVPSLNPTRNDEYRNVITARQLTSADNILPYGGKVALEGAYNFVLTDDHHIAVFANYTYKQDHTYRNEEYYTYAFSRAENSLYKNPEQYGINEQVLDSYLNAGIFNVHYNYSDVFNLKFTKLYSKISEKVTRITEGIANSDNDYKIRYNLNWEERTLDMNQLNGDMKYKVSNYMNNFSFGLEMGTAKLDQPNNYKYAYRVDTGPDQQPIGDPYLDRYSPNVFLNLTSNDDLFAYYLKNKTDISLFGEDEYIEVGFSDNSKTRESRYNKYSMYQKSSTRYYENIDNIYQNYLDDFELQLSFQPAYWYDAEIDEVSFYTNFFIKPLDNLEVLVGARKTDYTQTIYSYGYENIFLPIEKTEQSLNFNKILPSVMAKYIFDQKNQLSFSYNQTYIVPDLREFTDAKYFHPYEVAEVQGNPNLTNTDIFNYDLKYSHYFSSTENINLGLFYKYLDNPIEDTQERSSSLPIYSYANADYATLYGFEIDGRKSLSVFSHTLTNFFISGNFSYTKSEVTLTKEQEALYTSNGRELQGLSPTVVNLAFSYETKERDITLAYNKMGERIRRIGIIYAGDPYPDYYEVPPQMLDFIWIERFHKNLILKLKLKNLLDEETIWYQGSKDNITNRFKNGRTFSFGVSYKY